MSAEGTDRVFFTRAAAGPLPARYRSHHGDLSVVQDGGYPSARWPGDAYLYARRYLELLEKPTDA
jgi:hypothetical protein